MAVSYVFREHVVLPGLKQPDPERIGRIIERLPADQDKPTALWRAARAPRHYLNPCFQWDLQKAAEAHWRVTAEKIIRTVAVVERPGDVPKPAWVSVVIPGEKRSYRSASEIIDNVDLQRAVALAALRDIESWGRRYRSLMALCPMVAEAQQALRLYVETLPPPRLAA
jgi:hypothetical protein